VDGQKQESICVCVCVRVYGAGAKVCKTQVLSTATFPQPKLRKNFGHCRCTVFSRSSRWRIFNLGRGYKDGLRADWTGLCQLNPGHISSSPLINIVLLSPLLIPYTADLPGHARKSPTSRLLANTIVAYGYVPRQTPVHLFCHEGAQAAVPRSAPDMTAIIPGHCAHKPANQRHRQQAFPYLHIRARTCVG